MVVHPVDEAPRMTHLVPHRMLSVSLVPEKSPVVTPARLLRLLGDSYRWGRRAMSAAYARGSDAAFRDWRRAVRQHGDHIRQLAGRWPEELQGRQRVMEHLAELLDEDHELSLLAVTMGRGRDDQQALRAPVDQRRQALRAMARPLGRRLYGYPPPVFCRHLRGYCGPASSGALASLAPVLRLVR
jgi:hypothetical protein